MDPLDIGASTEFSYSDQFLRSETWRVHYTASGGPSSWVWFAVSDGAVGMSVLSIVCITEREGSGRGCNLSAAWLGILLDASIDLVPVVSRNYRRLLPADLYRSQGAGFAKGWPSQAQAGNYACPCSPVIRQLRCHTITVLIASVGLGHWWKSLPSLYLLGAPPVPSLLLLAVGRLGPRGLCIPPLQHSPCWCCPVAAVKRHLNKKLSSLISSLLLCHWAEDRVPISFTRTPGHKTLGLFLTSNQGALIKETVTSFMSLLA